MNVLFPALELVYVSHQSNCFVILLAKNSFVITGKYFQIHLLEAVTPEVFCTKVVLKISAMFMGKHKRWSLFLIKFQGLQHRWKWTPTQVFSFEYCGIFKKSVFYRTVLVFPSELFYWIQKQKTFFSINSSVRKTFKCSFPIDFAFNTSMRCSERTPKPETILYSKNFLAVIIYWYFLFVYIHKTYTFYFLFYSLSLFLLCYLPSA